MEDRIKMLKKKIKANDLTAEQVAVLIGMTHATFYRRLQKGIDMFTVKQVKTMKEILKLSAEEADAIFFGVEVA